MIFEGTVYINDLAHQIQYLETYIEKDTANHDYNRLANSELLQKGEHGRISRND